MTSPVGYQIPEEVADLVPDYLQRRKAEVQELWRFLSSSSWTEISRIGHRIKGTAAAYGFPRLGEIAKSLESAAGLQNAKDTERFIAEMDGEVRSIEKALS